MEDMFERAIVIVVGVVLFERATKIVVDDLAIHIELVAIEPTSDELVAHSTD